MRGRPSPQPSPTGRGSRRGPAFKEAGRLAEVSQASEHEPSCSRRDRGVSRAWVRGRPLTGFGRRPPNPSASSGQALPLPSERVKNRGLKLSWSLGRWVRGRPSPQPSPTGRGRESHPTFEGAGCFAKVSTGRGRKRGRGDSGRLKRGAGGGITSGRPSPQPSPTGRGSKSGRALADERRYAKVSLESGKNGAS